MTTRTTRRPLLIQLTNGAGRVPLAIAAALPLAFAGHAAAQSYEYEPDEGWHEEEWYDPSDWFNDDAYSVESDWYENYDPLPDADEYRSDNFIEGSEAQHRQAYLEGYRAGFGADEYSINYAEVGWDRPYTSSYSTGFYDGWEDSHGEDADNGNYGASFEDRTERGFSVGYTSMHHDAYYDGYYDGYNDDEFGADHYDGSWEAPYGTSYTSGYYDGFYDANQDYTFDPTYYVVTSTVTTAETDEKRTKDQSRKRGDRASRGDMSGSQAMSGDRKRGTVEEISEAEVEGRPEGHLLLELTMEDDEKVIADFGPRATRDRLPFSQGDRVTLVGETETEADKEVLVVKKIVQGQEQMTLRGPSRDMAMQGRRGDSAYNGQRPQQRGWTSRNTRVDGMRGMREGGQDGWVRQDSQSSQQPVSIRGTMDRVQRASRDVQGYRVFRVRMDDGRTLMLAFDGRRSDVRLQQGGEIMVQGKWRTLEGQRVIEVNRMRTRSGS